VRFALSAAGRELKARPAAGQANQQVTFLTDGGEDIRDLPCYLNPRAEHLLDWFHITMRITVMTTMAKSLRPSPPDPEFPAAEATDPAAEVGAELKRLKWFLWHGNVFRALQTVRDLEIDLDVEEPSVSQAKLPLSCWSDCPAGDRARPRHQTHDHQLSPMSNTSHIDQDRRRSPPC
jgi:hypothetical protein